MNGLRIQQLRWRLAGRLPLAFGVSGAIATHLFSLRDADRLIGVARDHGVSIFDTGPSYGAGLGERRLGKCVGNDPSVFVMTKAGLMSSGLAQRTSNFAPQSIVDSVEASLRRLRRDRIDLLWLHGPARDQITNALREMLCGLIDAGKVGAVGIASRNQPASLLADTHPFSAIMAPVHEARSSDYATPRQAVFFGIECLRNVPDDRGIPRHRSQIWRATRSIIRRQPPSPQPISVEAAFGNAFKNARCAIAVTTSTRPSRIKQNCEICEAIANRSPSRSDLGGDEVRSELHTRVQ